MSKEKRDGKRKNCRTFYEGIDCSQVVAGHLQKNWGSHRKKHIRWLQDLAAEWESARLAVQ